VTDRFKDYHPLVNFLYFALVLVLAMTLNHPLAQGISLLCALWYAAQCGGRKLVLSHLKLSIPMLLMTALVNFFFSHEGVTVLYYLPSGVPLTLESLLYGLSAGCMLVTVLMWFACFNRVMTADKFIYLFGRVIPALSLVLSMTLRFVPKFQTQMHAVTEIQRSMGRDLRTGSLWQRMRTAVVIFSVMITWCLENAIETADSMKSRGYGLPNRSAFSIYRFDVRDKIVLVWLLLCGLCLILGSTGSTFGFTYFPYLQGTEMHPMMMASYLILLLLCGTPIFLNILEERKWKAIVSNM